MKNSGLKIREFFYKFGKKWNEWWSTKEITKKFLYTAYTFSNLPYYDYS